MADELVPMYANQAKQQVMGAIITAIEAGKDGKIDGGEWGRIGLQGGGAVLMVATLALAYPPELRDALCEFLRDSILVRAPGQMPLSPQEKIAGIER